MVKSFLTTNFINRLTDKHKKLMLVDQFNMSRFLDLQFIGSVLIWLFLVVNDIHFLIALLVASLYAYMLYYMGVSMPLKRRTKVLEHEAILFFETLALSLQSGANLESAIDISVSNIDSALSTEFKRALMDVRFGKTLEESLSDMTSRIPSRIINNTIVNIHQSLKLGSSITDNLYEQINYLQEVEISNLKKTANTIPAKVSIISVILFIPLILLLIIGPVLLTLIK